MRYFLSILWIILLIILDAITKFWAETYLGGQSIPLIWDILSLEYAQNTGIAFSLPLSGLLLKVLTLILIFGIIWYYFTQERLKQSKILNISYLLIIAWALGNAWERIFREYVTDFISVKYFAIFNLADSYIFLWACGIFYFYFLREKLCHSDQKK